MSRILYAWELGADYGHISAFLPVARGLRERGHEVMMAVKDLHRVESVLGEEDWPVLPAPVLKGKVKGLPEPILTYGDLLLRAGFFDKSLLAGLVKAWRHLYALIQPDLLIVDHGPRALMAAFGKRIPCVLTGNGYFVPPPVSPLPNMRPWTKVSPGRLQVGEQKALEVANEVLSDLGMPRLKAISDLFDVEENFLCTFPELDPFHKTRGQAEYRGPVMVAAWGTRPPWPEGGGKKVFAYLKSKHPDFHKVLKALAEAPCSTLVYAAGMLEKEMAQYTSSRLAFSKEPLDMTYARETCDFAVCHAGHGTTTRMLLAGRPLLLLPLFVEQALRAMTVQDQGAGLSIMIGEENPDHAGKLARLIEDDSYSEKAKAFAERHGDLDPEAQIRGMVERCEEVMGEGIGHGA